MLSLRLAVLCLALTASLTTPVLAQTRARVSEPAAAAPPAQAPRSPEARRLPTDSVTHHTLAFGDRKLAFTATAGSITLSNDDGVAQAQIAYVAYTLDGAEPGKRPVTFAMNGGPGNASTFVDLGLAGPWRMHMDADARYASAPPVPVDNADTWLDFTDLVFIDPVGTGYSRLLVNSDETRKKYWSVDGDVASIADMISQWMGKQRRLVSPLYILGESYAGIRGPRLVRELESTYGMGTAGLILVSPALDFGGRSNALDPMQWIGLLPSLAASARAKAGPVTRAQVAEVESYAIGEYATDLMRGVADPVATTRREQKFADLTGLPLDKVVQLRGYTNQWIFAHERNRAESQVSSYYDSSVTMPDPFPEYSYSDAGDALSDRVGPAFSTAMRDIYASRLNWTPDGSFLAENRTVSRQWDFGKDRARVQSMTHLRYALALDSHLHVLIGHGLFDIRTPYFFTQLELNQIAPTAGADRVRLVVYPGGHMFYSGDQARAAFRTEAMRLYTP